MRKLIDRWSLREPLMDFAATGAPLFGTCAGMIILSKDIADGDEPVLPLLDVTVRRNAFGRQLDSFEGELPVPLVGDTPVRGVFIRAPVIERVGPNVDVLARLDDGRIVAVRERNIIATAFHPELAGETRFHRLVATMAADPHDPGEGSGRRHHPTRRTGTSRGPSPMPGTAGRPGRSAPRASRTSPRSASCPGSRRRRAPAPGPSGCR
jgi:5'-phosphate synthase pdxT subunit